MSGNGGLYRMNREAVKISGFVLTGIGLAGLLLVEFALDWGRPGTLTFAALNAAGLLCLILAFRGEKTVSG